MISKNDLTADEQLRYDDVQKLFQLCNGWVSGTVKDDAFLAESLALRRRLTNAEWGPSLHPSSNRLMHSFNLAVECVLAVERAMEDIEMLVRNPHPPSAVKAFYFAKRADSYIMLELNHALSLD